MMALNPNFIAPIEVLEPNSENHAYAGEVLGKDRLRLSLKDKRPEFIVGIGALSLAIILMLLTLPITEKTLLSSLTPEMHVWIKGFLERFATSAVVTAAVSLVNVALYYLDLKRKSIIQWIFD